MVFDGKPSLRNRSVHRLRDMHNGRRGNVRAVDLTSLRSNWERCRRQGTVLVFRLRTDFWESWKTWIFQQQPAWQYELATRKVIP